jgi:hypothetical protein
MTMDDTYRAYDDKFGRKNSMWKTMNGGYPGKYCPVVARARPYRELSDIVDFIELQNIQQSSNQHIALSK